MGVAEIIIACLAVSMLLMCCVTCFILYVYHKTSSRLRRASRGRTPKQVTQLPPPPLPTNQKVVDTPLPPPLKAEFGEEEVKKGEDVIGNEHPRIAVPAAAAAAAAVASPAKRPNQLRIDTNKACPAQSAIAMETYVRRGRRRRRRRRESFEEMRKGNSRDYSAESFLANMTQDTTNRRRLLQDEFMVLSRTEARRLTRSSDRAARYASANRYSDIVPYDHTLVELDGGDYINASFVQGESDAMRWIATQGPIDREETVGKETVSDFWRMVVQYDVACIVMLGQHHENFTKKCGEYWPSSMGKTERYGNVEVKVVCELEEQSWVHREFDVSIAAAASSRASSRGKEKRAARRGSHVKVSHWQYKDWKDNDVPPVVPAFIEFLLQIRARHYTSPVVVHCSAGIGRTGVFIVTDNVISRFESEGIIDIFSEVNRSRQQRPSMVYTLTQYECIYDTIGEYLRQIKK